MAGVIPTQPISVAHDEPNRLLCAVGSSIRWSRSASVPTSKPLSKQAWGGPPARGGGVALRRHLRDYISPRVPHAPPKRARSPRRTARSGPRRRSLSEPRLTWPRLTTSNGVTGVFSGSHGPFCRTCRRRHCPAPCGYPRSLPGLSGCRGRSACSGIQDPA